MQRRLSGIMIRLKNITKNKNIITCDVYVEDCKEPVLIILDTGGKKLQNYELPERYEWCHSHINHAKRNLLEMDRENKLVNETTVMWY